jgi:hypothetical protein
MKPKLSKRELEQEATSKSAREGDDKGASQADSMDDFGS